MGEGPYAQDPATQLFVRWMVEQRNGSIDSTHRILESYGGRQQPLRQLHEWFSQLDEGDKDMVLTVVRQAVDSAVRGLVSYLDQEPPHLHMEEPPPGEYSKFAVYLQAYDNEEAYEADRPSYRSKNINGYPDPYNLYEKYVDAAMTADEEGEG